MNDYYDSYLAFLSSFHENVENGGRFAIANLGKKLKQFHDEDRWVHMQFRSIRMAIFATEVNFVLSTLLQMVRQYDLDAGCHHV